MSILSLAASAAVAEKTAPAECVSIDNLQQQKAVEWIKSNKLFNVQGSDLGWHDWMPSLEKITGLKNSISSPSGESIEIPGLFRIAYDGLKWAEADLNKDGAADFVAITYLLQGVSAPFVQYDLLVFCGEPREVPHICGAVRYGREPTVMSYLFDDAGLHQPQNVNAVQSHPGEAFFIATLGDGSSAIMVAGADGKGNDGKTYQFGVWVLSDIGLVFRSLCE